MRKVAIVGGGCSKWGARRANWKEMVQEAGKVTFEDVPDISKKEVDSLFVGAASPDRTHVLARTELACASGQAAIRYAWLSIAMGLSDVALVMGAEKMNLPDMAESQTTMTAVLDREWDAVHGASAPPFFAMCAQRHMHEYGTTRDQLSAVSVKNHHFSTMNPTAQFQKEFTKEKVAGAYMIAPPLTLLDCSGITDGAAGVILTHEEKAKELTDTPMWIKGSGQATVGNICNGWKSLSTWEPLRLAVKEAYRTAKIGPDDIDVAELHDCFTISEIIEYEEFGFCKKGEGGKFVEEGQSDIGGKVPVNTRGGLLGCGHPLGATGIGQAVGFLEQFRKTAPQGRLVDDVNIAVAHNLSGASNVHSIMVYGRDK